MLQYTSLVNVVLVVLQVVLVVDGVCGGKGNISLE